MPTPHGGGPGVTVDPFVSLPTHASQLYDDLRLVPLLRRLVRTSCELTHALGGSISLVDLAAGQYTKVAEVGTACRLGQSFPLDEGVTGRVVSSREPVALQSYRDVATGHLAVGHPASEGSVVAVPIWWRGEIIAVNVIFAGVSRPFSAGEVDHLEVVTQIAAAGLVTAIRRELPKPARGETGTAQPRGGTAGGAAVRVADVVRDLVGLAERGPWAPLPSSSSLEVTLVREGGSTSLLMRAEPEPTDTDGPGEEAVWHELRDADDGGMTSREIGAALVGDAARRPRGPVSPFSVRERQVATLVAQGRSDRAMAEELLLSRKTVEKHVGAVLRKTGTTTRTAAVVRALELGWL